MPNRSDGVDDPLGGQMVCPGNFGLACSAAIQGAAFFQQLRTGGPVDGPIHTPATDKGFVGGVDDGVNSLPGDIPHDDFHSARIIHSFSRDLK